MRQEQGQNGAATPPERTRVAAPDSLTASASRPKLRVLLVEDNADHALLARRALEQRGHCVTAAMGAAEAMTALGECEFDVIAVDYQLPDATGLELLERISAREMAPPVVMVTASGSEQVAVTALKSGARDYVVKMPGYEGVLARTLELAREQARADSAEAALRAELERRAKTDHLTGLLNRGEMEAVIATEIERAQRYHRPLSLGLMDVDGFKQINDNFGHLAGDAVLRHLGYILQGALRSSDAVSRWGGDEFALLLLEAGFSVARAFADRLQRLVNDARVALGDQVLPPVTLSVGFVSAHGGQADMPALLRWADRALYAAKAAGRNRTKFFVLGEEAGGANVSAVEVGQATPSSPSPREAR